jgi:pimeloyl-ACP methyl ester carboxylesterase
MRFHSIRIYEPWGVVALAICLVVPITQGSTNAAPATSSLRVDVGGYRLHSKCRGNGQPTIVIEAASGEAGTRDQSWKAVTEALSRTHRVFRYDRASLGSSDAPPSLPRTFQDSADDLHRLLTKVQVPGPYVLVGHSIGGLLVRCFADRYPTNVVGMVLVDSSHPAQWATHWAASSPPSVPSEKPDVQGESSQVRPGQTPEEHDLVAGSDRMVHMRTLGDLPLVVLTRGQRWRLDPTLTDAIARAEKNDWQEWMELQKSLLTLSTRSRHYISVTGGHYLQLDDPELVINAIQVMLAELPKAKSLPQ